jgi:flagellar biosynthesis protein FlhG
MPDQADILRQLIHTASPAAHTAHAGSPMIVVTGSRSAVGATAVAVNLAAVLADRIQRVLLIDAAVQRSNMAEIAGVRSTTEYSLEDVLLGKCAAAEAIASGPVGTLLLTNHGRRKSNPAFTRHAQQRLLAELESLRDSVDLLVIDAGTGLTPWARRFWLRAQLVLLVTTADDAALMDTYAAIKLNADDTSHANVRVLVNQSVNDRVAADAHRRLTKCCHRFLSRTIPALPPLPLHVPNDSMAATCAPRVWEQPNSPFGHAALWLGRAVSDLLSTTPYPSMAPTRPPRPQDAELAPC